MTPSTSTTLPPRSSEFTPPPGDFTVGWICALPVERAAASCLLDREYRGHGFGGRYTVGRMGEHDLVIACLPAGLIGTNSAASVSTQLQIEFPSIRIRLLVGIGGGVPSPADVRLGDVVISQPQNGYGGVVQYDYGKTVEEGRLRLNGFLNAPPTELLDAAAQLRALLLEHKDKLSDHLNRFGAEFSREQAGPDVLYAADSKHNASASTCVDCDTDAILERSPRASNAPVIHFGTIASANQVMKDGVTRDRRSVELGGVLCYEMEAAGLMASFPSLVIRGICDYSDQHKNKSWQPFAAASASAVAKEILLLIPVRDYKAQQNLNREIQEIRRKFPAPDSSVDYRKAIQSRQPGTGTWLYEDERYIHWKSQGSALWLYGIPGCGKTVLSAGVVEDLRSTCGSENVAFFYFVFNDSRKQVTELMIRSLVYQLLERRARPSAIRKLSSGSSPSIDDLLNILYQLVREFPHTYVVLDALDECEDRVTLLGAIQTMSQWRLETLHILVTGRMERDLEEGLDCVVNVGSRISLQSNVVNPDIHHYVQSQLLERRSLKKWQDDPILSETIRDTIANGARGMFRWATCQLDQIAKCRNRSQLRNALSSLPLTLNATYDRIVQNIQPEDTEYALRILRWLAFSERPLLVEELAEAVAINVDCNTTFDPDQILQDPFESLDICSSLITIDSVSGAKYDRWIYGGSTTHQTVSLAHYSVKEYLINYIGTTPKMINMKETESHRILAMSCVAYLSQFDSIDQKRIEAARFSKYCVQNWAMHARKSEAKALDEQIIQFLFSESFNSFNRLYDVWDPSDPPRFDKPSARMPTPLSVAVHFHLAGVVESMILRGIDVNHHPRGPSYSALRMAVNVGDAGILELLLASGADFTAQIETHHTLLHVAAAGGQIDIVRRLIAVGADVNAFGGMWGSVLCAATSRGCIETVDQILAAGANVNARLKFEDGGDGNVLHEAAILGNRRICQRLLAAGADPDAVHKQFGSVLAAAVWVNQELIVQDLIAAGANVDIRGGCFDTAIHTAAHFGRFHIVSHLLAAGAPVNTFSDIVGTVLHAAVKFFLTDDTHRDTTVKVLLDRGADINAFAHGVGTPLHSACYRGHDSTVALLIERGADVHAKDDFGRTASQIAARNGDDTILKLLQQRELSQEQQMNP